VRDGRRDEAGHGARYRVVHHATTNLVEDPEEDPVGLFFNEYALGKNGDIFPPNSGRLVKAGSKINFNLHLHPNGEATPTSVSVAMKVFPAVRRPDTWRSRSTWAISPTSIFRPARSAATTDISGCRAMPSSRRSSAHAQPRQGDVHGSDLSGYSRRLGATDPARTETLSCVSNYQFGWHITYPYADDVAPLLPAGTIIHITAWHDNSSNNKTTRTRATGWATDSGRLTR
jgi:hypothetical protein